MTRLRTEKVSLNESGGSGLEAGSLVLLGSGNEDSTSSTDIVSNYCSFYSNTWRGVVPVKTSVEVLLCCQIPYD